MRARGRMLLGFVVSLAMAAVAAGEQAAAPVPPVSDQAFRLDPATGALTALEQVKEKREERTRSTEYRYLEGARSSVSLPGDQPLQFVIRVDGGARELKDRRLVCHFLEPLSPREDRRYRTAKGVRLEQEFSEIVPGLDPRKPKNSTLRIRLSAPGTVPPGEYAITLDVCARDAPMYGPQYGAFRVVAVHP